MNHITITAYLRNESLLYKPFWFSVGRQMPRLMFEDHLSMTMLGAFLQISAVEPLYLQAT
jgi:hypothetical protein